MDKHDVAHYGIAAALAAAIGTGAYVMPHAQKTWPTLTDAQAVDIIKNISMVLGKGQPIGVWCIDRECNKITRQLRAAGKSAKVTVDTDRPQAAPDGLVVGAKSLTEATAMQSAIEHFSDHVLHAGVNVGQDTPYISFGHFVDDEKMTYGKLESENVPVGVRSAGTPESEADAHGLAAWRKKRARGGKVDGEPPKARMDRRAKGGRTNGKGVKINVIVAPQGGAQPGAGGPPMPPPGPPPAAAMPPPRPPMPMAPPQGMPPQMPPGAPMRKDGGRVHMNASAANGEGRLEKIKAYGKNAKGAAG